MIWGSFSYYGFGPIYKIDAIMDQHVYLKILRDITLPFAEENMPLRWVLMQDNDPKHTSKRTKQWFKMERIDVMEWPPQSPDLNPIENLWTDVKFTVSKAKPRNVQQLWEEVQSAWLSIPVERCQRLVNSMPRRCKSVLENKGLSTKY